MDSCLLYFAPEDFVRLARAGAEVNYQQGGEFPTLSFRARPDMVVTLTAVRVVTGYDNVLCEHVCGIEYVIVTEDDGIVKTTSKEVALSVVDRALPDGLPDRI